MFVSRARLLIAALWVGSLWTTGYLVAPTLFATLPDRVLAGTIAGSLFRVEAWVSVLCAFLLLLLISSGRNESDPKQRRTCLILTVGMLACTLIGYFGLQPLMATLRESAGPGGVMASNAKMQFGILHGVSSGIYLIQSLLGAALMLKIR